MKVSGFTFIRNAVKYDYPVLESIQSVLPLCDEFVVNICSSEDNTEELIASMDSEKLKIVRHDWNFDNFKSGSELRIQTDNALSHCTGDWCFYIQADEVLHEKDRGAIAGSMQEHLNDTEVEGLIFDYHHFYGSYHVLATSRGWYRREVRIVRNGIGARSFGDAQGFRIQDRKPRVALSGGRVFHYGWVKDPSTMGLKKKGLDRLWHGDKALQDYDNFQFIRHFGLKPFSGSHPEVMKERVKKQDWRFDIENAKLQLRLGDIKNISSSIIETIFGYRVGEYKNYVLIR